TRNVVFIGCLRSVTNSSQPMLTGISSFFFKETAPNTLVDGLAAPRRQPPPDGSSRTSRIHTLPQSLGRRAQISTATKNFRYMDPQFFVAVPGAPPCRPATKSL
ncbi:MAG: hypothetical protein ACYDH9_02260, partial [Limisphaerales bacterium]